MKRIIIIAVAALATVAGAGNLVIVSSFRSPVPTDAAEIDYHEGYIYHVGKWGSNIYVTTTTGSLTHIIGSEAWSWGVDRGLWLSNLGFWTVGPGGYLNRLTTAGSLVRRLRPTTVDLYGVAYQGDTLYCSAGNTLLTVTTRGSITGSFTVPTTTARGVAADPEGSYIWLVSYAERRLFKMTVAGRMVGYHSFKYNLRGVTCGPTHFYVVAGDYVYRVRISPTAVRPASLGRVRAVFK